MNAACFLEPEVAKNTLWAVCQRKDGKLFFQMDNQNWDKIVWALGAWSYYLVSDDREFLTSAYETIANSLSILEENQFDKTFSLFTGGSFFNDGISGYPACLHQPGNDSSFVCDHQETSKIMVLSTNCLYYAAYRILGKMARIQGETERAAEWETRADVLKAAINNRLWLEKTGRYGYFMHPDGRVDETQEGCGLSCAMLFGVCREEKAKRILENVELSRYGLVSLWPPFDGISSVQKPLRHNNLIWPFINGYFADAAAKCRRADLLAEEMTHIAELVRRSGNHFQEIYNPETGGQDGGWQCGWHWETVEDQTWSATGYIRMVVFGLFGVTLHEDDISFAPCLPRQFRTVSLTGLRIRNVVLDLVLEPANNGTGEIRINGKIENWIDFSHTGTYRVVMMG